MRVALISLMLAALLTGCQSLTSYRDDPGSRYYPVPAGARFTLNRSLTFEPHQASVYIQYGQVMRMSQVQQYDPFCKLQLEQLSASPRSIGPADMTVTRTQQYTMETAFSEAAPRLYAQLSFTVAQGAGGGEPDAGGVPLFSFIMRMDLDSAAEPQLFRLTCARWFYPGMEDRVTVADIRRTLSPLITLRLPADRAGSTRTD